MPSNIMSEELAIKIHLNLPPAAYAAGGKRLHSGFWEPLKNTREVTGRDPETGQKLTDKIHAKMHGNWLGAIGYMSLLDQIGKCFKPKSIPELKCDNPIEQALLYFSHLNSPVHELDRGALYALRCAFTHDYSLYHIPKSKDDYKRKKYRRRFTVTQGLVPGMNTPVVQLPQVDWDGEFTSMEATDNITTVNLEAFGDMVEEVCENLYMLEQKRELEVVLPGGSDELIRRYTFAVSMTSAQDTVDVFATSAQTKVT